MGDMGNVVTEKVQQGTQQVAEGTQQAVSQVTEQARQQATSFLDGQKSQATSTLTSIADALRQTGDSLRTSDQAMVAGVTDKAADQVESVSNYLQQRQVGDFVYEAENYARNNTWLFLGGAFTLGLLAARFLKSSGSRSNSSNYDGSYGGYGQNYGYGNNSGQNYGYASNGGQSYGGGMPAGQYDYGTVPHRFDDVGTTSTVERGYAPDLTGTTGAMSTATGTSDLTETDTLLETNDGPSDRSY